MNDVRAERLQAGAELVLLGLEADQRPYYLAAANRIDALLAKRNADIDAITKMAKPGQVVAFTPFDQWLRDTLKHFGISHSQLIEGLNIRAKLQDEEQQNENIRA